MKKKVTSIIVEKGAQDIKQHEGGSISMGRDGIKLYRLMIMKQGLELWFKGLKLPNVKHDVFEQARKEFGLSGRNHDVYLAFCEMHGLEHNVTWTVEEAAEREDDENSGEKAEKKAIAEFVKQTPEPGPAKFSVTMKKTIEEKEIHYLLCAALEGGIGSWAQIVEYVYADGVTRKDVEFPHVDLPLMEGCAVILADAEGDVGSRELWRLDRAAIQRGLEVMQEKYPKHFANFVNDNYDADTGDNFVQCCLFGKVVYG